ncbi:MAG: hypothetical protein GX976_08965 [Bacteroidales bacterium]|nr:hypothetical protein [Bacteroidales bacterium]
MAFVITSCSSDESIVEQVGSVTHVEVMGISVELKNNTLALNNESELQNLVSKLKAPQSVSTSVSTRQSSEDVFNNEVSIDGFKSLYDIFVDAMKNAESYYDREGGYEEFKEKYASLYFPEYGDDYSAYLPVSDPALSKFLNSDGEIIIDGETVNMKDISTYEQLRELGLTPPEEVVIISDEGAPSNTRVGNIFFPGTPFQLLPNKTFQMNNRRIWVTLDDVTVDNIARTKAGFDICFRKKGFLGAWYNHWALTKTYAHIGPQGLRVVDNKTIDGYSSHDHSFFLVNGTEISTPTPTPGYYQKDVYGEAQIYYDALRAYTFIVPLHYRFFRWW